MLSQVVINQGNFALQNRAENVVQTVVHCFSITSSNKLIINKIIPLSQSPLGSPKGHLWVTLCRIYMTKSRGSVGSARDLSCLCVRCGQEREEMRVPLPLRVMSVMAAGMSRVCPAVRCVSPAG